MSLNKRTAGLLLLVAAPVSAEAATRARWVMGTVCEITAHGPRAAGAMSAAFAEIERWDRVLSLYKKESELSAANRQAARAPFPCSESLWEALTLAVDYAQASGGAFDPTILPVLKEGPASLERVGWQKLILDKVRRTVSFSRPGMGLDFGGIGKGLALDHAVKVLRENGVSAAMINFGGQIAALGAPPGKAGWSVKVAGQDGDFLLNDASVSTSGDAERPGHIASPFTGRPVRAARSVTVLAPSGAAADAWSTALFVRGAAPADFGGCALWPESPPPAACRAYLKRNENDEQGASSP